MGGVATTKDDWRALAEAVLSRRAVLDLTQEDVAAAGGPSTSTMRLIEGALQDGYTPVILRRLEDALRWKRGSVRDVIAGGSPVPLEEVAPRAPAPPPPSPVLGHLLDALEAANRSLARAVLAEASDGRPFTDPVERAIWASPDWSPRQRAAEIANYRAARARFADGAETGTG